MGEEKECVEGEIVQGRREGENVEEWNEKKMEVGWLRGGEGE